MPATELVVGGDRLQPVLRQFAQRLLVVVEEIRVRALAPAPDAPADLVQLRQPVLVGPVDDERVRVGDVDARSR